MELSKDNIELDISKDFTTTPGAEYIKNGPYSGEEFYYTHLITKYQQAFIEEKQLMINIDGVYGLPMTFIRGSFVKLLEKIGNDEFYSRIRFVSLRKSDIIDLLAEINYIIGK